MSRNQAFDEGSGRPDRRVTQHERWLDELAHHTGMRLHGTHVEFPGGVTLRTNYQDLDVHKDEGPGHELIAGIEIPSEYGHIHHVRAFVHTNNPKNYGVGTIKAPIPYLETDKQQHVHSQTGYNESDWHGPNVSREQFGHELFNAIDNSIPPKPLARKTLEFNAARLKNPEYPGRIEVTHSEPLKGYDPTKYGYPNEIDSRDWNYTLYNPKTRQVEDNE